MVAGDELDISAYPNNTTLRAVAWINGSAASAVAEYTIQRYGSPLWTLPSLNPFSLTLCQILNVLRKTLRVCSHTMCEL